MRRILLTLLLLVGCSDDGDEEDLSPVDIVEPPPRPEPEEPEEPEEPVMVRRSRPIMGTVFQVTVLGMPEAEAAPLIDRALDEIDRLETVLSEWQDDTEISRINAGAGGEPVTIGHDTSEVLRASLDVSRWSHGAFDPTWAALRGMYRFTPEDTRVPAVRDVRARLRNVGYEGLELDLEGNTARLAREGMALGTGGVGKGYALDRAGDLLREGGAESYMLFGGGQVQVHGMRGDRPWRVGIQHPRDPATYIGFLEATSGSMSTSGDYEHAFVDDDGTHWHHIIDLSTGLPARRSMQVTLLAEEGMYADALSTACFIMGAEACLEMLEEVPGEHQAVIIDDNLVVHTTPGTEERVVWRVERDEVRLPGEVAFRGWQRAADPVGVQMPGR